VSAGELARMRFPEVRLKPDTTYDGFKKERTMSRMHAIVIAVVALSLGVAAQDRKSDPATVSGVWQMSVQGDHVIPIGMELKQDGKSVTGIILMPAHNGQRKKVSLTGEFADGSLELNAAESDSEETAKLEIAAKMQQDGTMSGTLLTGKHSVPWTGERLGR
jgi:hypothetical protein